MDWTKIKHFKPDEFDDPRYPGSGESIHPKTVLLLDKLRERTGWPIVTHNKFGIRGCVCIDPEGHAKNSLHYYNNGARAVDFHFDCDEDARKQAMIVLAAGFGGIGVYPDWHWDGKKLPIGFHVDTRNRPQVWVRRDVEYIYLLP